MTTPTLDVNERFRTDRLADIADRWAAPERARQRAEEVNRDIDARIADGRLVPLGDGRFRVNEPGNWDDGEIWYQRRINVDGIEQQVILPQHGLDTSAGGVSLYSAVPIWHELGQVIPGGITDIQQVMELAYMNWMVQRTPVMYRNLVTGELEALEGQFVNCRLDSGKGLGVVGDGYEIFQNYQAFDFLEALVGRFGVTWESAGVLRGGAKVFVCMRLPKEIRIDAAGINDEIQPFIVITTSHDGSSKIEVMATPWRPVCGNTERFARRDAHVKWGTRHTKGVHNKIDEARFNLKMSLEYYEGWIADEEKLAQTPFGTADMHKLIDEIWGEVDGDATKKARTSRNKLIGTLDELWAKNVAQLGPTAYTAERVVTEWADWHRGVKPRHSSLKGRNAAARATAVIEDSAGDVKSNAHRRLMLRVNR